MTNLEEIIYNFDKQICNNIRKITNNNRGEISQNILPVVRKLVEYIFILFEHGNNNIDIDYPNFEKAKLFVSSRGNYSIFKTLYDNLNTSTSHYYHSEIDSERLFLKYIAALIEIKKLLRNNYNIEILKDINLYPFEVDKDLRIYYDSILNTMNSLHLTQERNKERFYVINSKPVFFNDERVLYEITYQNINDYEDKYDRSIAFSNFNIPSNYAVKLEIIDEYLSILDHSMPVQFITDWQVSIRYCEINSLANILAMKLNSKKYIKEYNNLMDFLTITNYNLLQLLNLTDSEYETIKLEILNNIKPIIFNVLDKCRTFIRNKYPGYNVIKYLLFNLQYHIICDQICENKCLLLSNLHLKYGCIPFDKMPLCTSLLNHNPSIYDLLSCYNPKSRLHEMFARKIKLNSEKNGKIYICKDELKEFDNHKQLISEYNSKIYKPKHMRREIRTYKQYYYILGYEETSKIIIETINSKTDRGIDGYSFTAKDYIEQNINKIDCNEKKRILIDLFGKSKVVVIYGAAGTGKSTLINHIANIFNSYSKLLLTHTNPALDNLRNRVRAANIFFSTVTKFNYNYSDSDLIILDESSVVKNEDIENIVLKSKDKLLVLVGDPYQIESIEFGNWFNFIKHLLPSYCISELTKTYRSENKDLIKYWDLVRNNDKQILERGIRNKFTKLPDSSIFKKTDDEEIILCLKYGGIYGVNNLNKFLQSINSNDSVIWNNKIYKKHDPILFNKSKRFSPTIYNNLRGKIIDFHKYEDKIIFKVEINKVVNEFDGIKSNFKYLGQSSANKSLIQFNVIKHDSNLNNNPKESYIPFNVAYAVSIHKAQGLEFNSVKVIISENSEENITHNIFYTAITRAKEKLRIYWTPEVEIKILNSFTKFKSNKDFHIFKHKYDNLNITNNN